MNDKEKIVNDDTTMHVRSILLGLFKELLCSKFEGIWCIKKCEIVYFVMQIKYGIKTPLLGRITLQFFLG